MQPAIEGNSNLYIVARYEWGADDVLLLQDTGGSACPAQFRISATLGQRPQNIARLWHLLRPDLPQL